MGRVTREEILGEYRKLKLKLGHAPTSGEFYDIVRKSACEDVFPKDTYSTIQAAAGDQPRRFGRPARSQDEFFEVYGRVVREVGKRCPTGNEWRSKGKKPVVDSYRKQLNIKWSQMPRAFINWAIDKPEWKDVVKICDSHCKKNGLYQDESGELARNRGYVYLMKGNRKGQYKIGRTGSPSGRASQLSQLDAHDRKYEHVFETSDPVAFEKYWTEYRFREKKINKEIFELTPDDVRTFKDFFARKAHR